MTDVSKTNAKEVYGVSFNVLRQGANDPAEWFPKVIILPRVKE